MTLPKPSGEEFLTLSDAYTNALLYGIGILKIVNTPQGPVMSVVDIAEYDQLGRHMRNVAQNTVEPKDGTWPQHKSL